MQADLDSSRDYLDRVRRRRGDEAAAGAEAGIRAPYLQRMEKIRAAGQDRASQEILLVTVWGEFHFSAVSYDGGINPKDPVSVLFYGDTSMIDVYERMTGSGGREPSYQDEDGPLDSAAMRECRSQTQWVLMASGEEPLTWRQGARGLMRAQDRCTAGSREHLRLYGDLFDVNYGHWIVATPHRETWEGGHGHMVESWTSAQLAVADFWRPKTAPGSLSAAAADPLGSNFFDWGNGGWYQGIPFPGLGVCIGIRSGDPAPAPSFSPEPPPSPRSIRKAP